MEILMQAVEIARDVVQQERRRPVLACVMALLQIGSVADWKLLVQPHPRVPRICKIGKMGVKRRADAPRGTKNSWKYSFHGTGSVA